MLARLTVAVPFTIVVPEGAGYNAYSYEDDGCVIVAHPPGKSNVPLPHDLPTALRLDGAEAFAANAVQFDFIKPAFDRRRGLDVVDPPIELMQRVVTSFLSRLRYVARAPQIQPIDLKSGAPWRLQYLNEDTSELPADPDLIRARGQINWRFSLVAVPPAVWNHVYELANDWTPPAWDDILLDASHALPKIGTAVVLAATALEVFIADVLERYAASGDVPSDIWTWMNDRDNWLKDPSADERFDSLLRHFVGRSLKDDVGLWQAFKELRKARNSFVHEGRAMVGGVPLTLPRAAQLIAQASAIVALVRGWLSLAHQWPVFEHTMEIGATFPLTPAAESAT